MDIQNTDAQLVLENASLNNAINNLWDFMDKEGIADYEDLKENHMDKLIDVYGLNLSVEMNPSN